MGEEVGKKKGEEAGKKDRGGGRGVKEGQEVE